MGLLDPSVLASKALEGASASEVSAAIGGYLYQGWTSMEVTRSVNALAGSFRLDMTDKWRPVGTPWQVTPGKSVVLSIGSNIILTGWIDSLEGSISSDSRTFTISGRDRTADLIDCCPVSTPNQFIKQNIHQIAQVLCQPFGVFVENKTPSLPIISKWNVKEGETVFENIERAARAAGLLLITSKDGNLVLTDRAYGSFDVSSTDLVEGENILEGSVTYDDTERFSAYTVKGQHHGDEVLNSLQASSPVGSATDPGVERFRPLVVIAENDVETVGAQRRAEWEATTRAAQAIDASVTVQGWRKKNGALWAINTLVGLDSGFLGIKQNMLITEVTFSKTVDGGTKTKLSLTRPDAFKPQAVVSKTDDPKTLAGPSATGFLGGLV